MFYRKIKCTAWFRKRSILFLIFVLPLWVRAQTDSVLLLVDSLENEQAEMVQEAEDDQDPSSAATENEYFLNKRDAPRSSTIIQRNVPDSLVKKMQQEDDFWYANMEHKEEKTEIEEPRTAYTPISKRKWFQDLLLVLIIAAFAGVLIWYLAGSNVGLFQRKNKKLETADGEELSTEDIFAINYQKEINKAEAARNYRLAIRLMFLRLLKEMAGKNIIRYKQDRTNLDYLFQLHTTAYYDNFFRVCRNYEYSWYGQFEVSETGYTVIRNDFEKFNHQLTSV